MGCINSVPSRPGGAPANLDSVVNDSAIDRKMSVIMREKRAAQRRHDVFAESVQFDEQISSNDVTLEALESPRAPKSPETTELIVQALMGNFLFYAIDRADVEAIADEMTEKVVDAGDVVINEGDSGDFVYVVESGQFTVTVKGSVVGSVQRGACFGELALIYNCPRTATVSCATGGKLWALDRITFRRLVARLQREQLGECKNALRKVTLLHPLTESQLGQLAEAAQLVTFAHGERIIKKGERGNVLYIIKSGSVLCTDFDSTGTNPTSLQLTENDYFGERALMTHEPRAANVTAETDVTLIALDRQAFDDLLGSLREVIDHNLSVRVLQSIPLLQHLSAGEKERLFEALEPVTFADGEYVIREGEAGSTFYIIKSGSAIVKTSGDAGPNQGKAQVATLTAGHFFGEMSLLRGEPRKADVIADGGALECLQLDRDRFVELLGPVQDVLNREAEERGLVLRRQQSRVLFDDLAVLRTLGCGTFGRVKLVKHRMSGMPYAMKVIRKAQVVAFKQQKNVMNEKRIMARCDHPFILKLFETYQDARRLYLLLEFVQGGELFTYLHCTPSSPGKIANDHARFYASHVLLALEYLHDRHIVYRDLKPENLLIDPQGYLKVVDFGFAKVVEDRSYTLCGTPEYLAPELVLGKGHNRGVDYWALGVLIYEMVVGHSPFSGGGSADQVQIYRNIIKERPEFPAWVSDSCKDLVLKLLERDQTRRLGLTRGGARAIRTHAWFDKLSWDAVLQKRETAPYKPKLANPLDASKFDMGVDDEAENETDEYVDDGSGWDKDF
jgi:CRP-like cAMP-binding protein